MAPSLHLWLLTGGPTLMTGDGNPADGSEGLMWMPMQPPTLERILAWHPQPIPVLPVAMLVLIVGYLVAVLLLRRRGVRWPWGRTAAWFVGALTVVAVTGTGIDGYGMEMFSVHMVQHMVLNMFSPILLALGAPVTLLLRVLPASRGLSGSARRTLLRALHSRPARIVAHPATTLALFLMSLYGLYFTPVFDVLMGTWWGHNIMLVHFLLIGMLYFWGILGVDPSPRKSGKFMPGAGAVLPVLEIAVTTPFHAFFGIVVMMSTTLIVNSYAVPMPGWHLSPLADQATGGGIAWGFTELPTLLVLAVLVVKWQRSEQRANRAADRRRAREGDVDLDAYNNYLQALASRDGNGTA
ncbi:cytochrome c oxidase assembly protein [Arthrobacter sp.]|uniref:cytochrome c oxidase assembly protein n=1 Tax=Arthrobacter sp. TaxID=1667 RepID=UPI003A8F9409